MNGNSDDQRGAGSDHTELHRRTEELNGEPALEAIMSGRAAGGGVDRNLQVRAWNKGSEDLWAH
jgi:hypothetical protein